MGVTRQPLCESLLTVEARGNGAVCEIRALTGRRSPEIVRLRVPLAY